MIKLNKDFHPLCLNPSKAKHLTDEFKTTKASVWNFDALKSALLETSHGKCAYCECDLTQESKYMEVEHFRDKDTHPDDVVEWINLLPSCKRCNASKGTHDVLSAPIVNPYEADPRDHFLLKHYRLRPKTSIGQESLGVLDLNNSDRAVLVRFDIGESIHKSLESAFEILTTYKDNGATRTKNRLLGVVRHLLLECQPSSEYAATASTIVHGDETYRIITDELEKLGLWNAELTELHEQSKNLAFDEKESSE
jgi:hypothetical protein